MARDTGFELKIDQFNAFTRELGRKSKVSLQEVIESEVSAILSKAAKSKNLRIATEASIRKSNIGKTWMTHEGKKVNRTWRFTDAKWAAVNQTLENSIKKKMQKRGLGSSAFIDIADKAGLIIKAPSVARKAKKPPGFNTLTMVNKNIDPERFFIMVENRSRILRFANGSQALFGAIAGRIKFFETNMKRGVFKSSATIAKKYPGIKVTS